MDPQIVDGRPVEGRRGPSVDRHSRADTARIRCAMMLVLPLLALSLLALSSPRTWAASHGTAMTRQALKIYVSVDMEGVAGVVSGDQLNPPGFEYERFRGFMTDEALAAVRAAVDSGATEVVVSDSHGNGENLLVERFPKDVKLVRSFPRRGAMMAGLDARSPLPCLSGITLRRRTPQACARTPFRVHTLPGSHSTVWR